MINQVQKSGGQTNSTLKTVGNIVFSGLTYLGMALFVGAAIGKITESRTPDEELKTFLFGGIVAAILIFYLLLVFAAGFLALRLSNQKTGLNNKLLKIALGISFASALITVYYSTFFSL